MDFENAISNDVMFATQMMHQMGELSHMVVGYMPTGERLVTVLRCQDGREKDIAASVISALFALYDVEFYSHMSEAWMAVVKTEDEAMNITPSESPDRVEVVIVNGVSRTCNINKIFHIIRDRAEKFVNLDEMKEYETGMSAGRFSDLLPPMKISMEQKVVLKRMIEVAGFPPFMEVVILGPESTDKPTVN